MLPLLATTYSTEVWCNLKRTPPFPSPPNHLLYGAVFSFTAARPAEMSTPCGSCPPTPSSITCAGTEETSTSLTRSSRPGTPTWPSPAPAILPTTPRMPTTPTLAHTSGDDVESCGANETSGASRNLPNVQPYFLPYCNSSGFLSPSSSSPFLPYLFRCTHAPPSPHRIYILAVASARSSPTPPRCASVTPRTPEESAAWTVSFIRKSRECLDLCDVRVTPCRYLRQTH